jgi:DNA/RNA endonuclease G (NUC1)
MRIRTERAALIALAVVIASCTDSGLLGPGLSGIPQQATVAAAAMPSVRISEIHYDNVGGDVGEAIEVSGPAGLDLTGYQVVLYNGNGGASYNTQTLSGTIPATCGTRGVVVVTYAVNGVQNGGAGTATEPDGVALAAGATLVEFLSYEGVFTATNGPAMGTASTNIGVAEAGTEAVGQSLKRNGDGTWSGPSANSFGACNDENEEPPPPPAVVTSVAVSPPTATIVQGATQQFSATASDASSQPIAGVTFTWTSDAPSVATVSSTGLASGVAPGDAHIIATAPNGVADSAALHVNEAPPPSGLPATRFSEIHYDDDVADIDETIEISGPAGTDISGWKIYLYNGNGGTVYAPTFTLSGTIPATCGERGVIVQAYAATAGIQNGAPDGMALVDANGAVVEFLSYEGSFTAADGPAAGLVATDIGVLENGEAEGQSLQRNSDGTWYGPSAHSFGLCNTDFEEPPPSGGGVTFSGRNSSDPALPVGFQDQLFATVTNGSSTTVTWSSDTPDIASIDQDGVFTALAAGTAVLRATAPDGSTGTWSLPTRVGTESTTAEYQGNTEFGEPADSDPTDDFIVRRAQYTASFNKNRGTPNWVSYDLDATHFGAEDRCDCFTFDPALPSSFTSYTTADYTGAGTFHGYGIDRGHLARSFDRTTASFDNATTFYFSNIIPQAADLNQGPWATLENYLGDLARVSNKEVYIIAGPAGSKGTIKNEGIITIPEKVWKVAVIMPRDQGLANIDDFSDFEVIAVIAPNDAGVRSVNWETWKTTVDAVEALSGYNLLALLRDDIEIAAESGTRRPVAAVNGPYTSTEGTAVPMSAAGSTDPDGDALTFAWTFGDGGVATGTTVSHTYAQNGTYNVRVIATDVRGLADTALTTATIANVAPAFAAATGATIYPGNTYTGTGSFTDPGADTFTATVNYGDGSGVSALTLTGKTFALSHRYVVPGTYTITVSVSDGLATTTQTRTIVVLSSRAAMQSLLQQIETLRAANRLPADYARRLTGLLNRLIAVTPVQVPGLLDLDIPDPDPSKFMPLLLQLTAAGQELDGLVRSNRVTAADAATVRSGLARVLLMRTTAVSPTG